jgi:predicted ATPase
LALTEKSGVRWFEAELHRHRGELLRTAHPGAEAEAEASFRRAIAIARGQDAKLWELRAAASLARLWRDRGKRDQARASLAPVYGWFTEGFDTPDLKEAKALLDELSAQPGVSPIRA